MKIVFFGSSKYSCIVAEIIEKKLGLSLVVTHKDQPAGRKRKLKESPVKQFARKHGLAVLTCDKLDRKTIANITKVKPDFLVVADYGQILPKDLLKVSKHAPLNIHHSLLPKYRGSSPAPAAILAGETKSGTTVIEMTEKVDAGPILAQQEYTLTYDETTDSLLTKLNTLGGQLVTEVINQFLKESQIAQKQDETQATYTHRLKKEDGQISTKNLPNPQTLDRMIRAFYPWPGVWTEVKSQKSKVKIIKFLPDSPFLIQPEGKRPMTIREFKNGYPKIFEQIRQLYRN